MAKRKKKKKSNNQVKHHKNQSNHKKNISNKKNSQTKIRTQFNKKPVMRTTSKKITNSLTESKSQNKPVVESIDIKDNENLMADDFVKEFAPNYFKIAISSIIWAIIIIIIAIWSIDIYRIVNHEDPKLCLSKTIYEYDDGTITECNGLGYNIYHYERDKEDKYIFRPFFIKYDVEK